jgi:amidase
VPIGHGNDSGGSIRIPAACCGLVGLKPSRGRVSRGPDLGDSFLGVDGVLTRTVTDTAVALDVLGGYEVGDATWAPRPVEPYVTAMRRDPGRLRIGVTAANPLDVEPDAECVRGVQSAAELLAELGHDVVDASPPFPGRHALELFIRTFGPLVSLGITYGELLAGHPPGDDDIEPLSRAIVDLARETPSVGYLAAVAQLQAMSRAIIAFFAGYDVLLTPALAERPVEIGLINGVTDDPAATFRRSGQFTPYTAIANTTGQPAISLPLRQGDDGLPAAIQLIGRPAGEGQLLALAAQLEAARPWADRRAPVGALSA